MSVEALRQGARMGVCLLAMTFFGGCGGSLMELADRFRVVINEETETAELHIFLNPDVPFDLEGDIPVMDYGTVSFIPGSGYQPPTFIISYDYSQYHDELPFQVGATSKFPTGRPLPRSVVTPLFFLKLPEQSGGFTPVFYLSVKPDVQVGAAAVIRAMLIAFPEEVVFTQNFRASDGTVVAVFSIFGPKRGSLFVSSIPGGVFFCANLSRIKKIADGISGENPSAEGSGLRMLRGSGERRIIDMTFEASDTERDDPKASVWRWGA